MAGQATTLLRLLNGMQGHRVLVVGDVLLDEYLVGRASRLSREAPIPVLEFERRELIPGGASNPAVNIARLGSQPVQLGVVGDDANAGLLRSLLMEAGIDVTGLITDPERHTTTKTRILAQMGLRFPQQVARIDRIDRHAINGTVEQGVVARLRGLVEAPAPAPPSAVAVSDYLAGLLTPATVAAAVAVCQEHAILSIVDAQSDLDKYIGFDVVKCNADEAMRYVGRELTGDDDFAAAGLDLVQALRLAGAMFITRGPEGITIAQAGGPAHHVPAPRVEDVYDTVGAGDTVLAVLTLSLLAGATYVEAATLANLAAGIVVRHVGNYAPSVQELRAAIEANNLSTRTEQA